MGCGGDGPAGSTCGALTATWRLFRRVSADSLCRLAGSRASDRGDDRGTGLYFSRRRRACSIAVTALIVAEQRRVGRGAQVQPLPGRAIRRGQCRLHVAAARLTRSRPAKAMPFRNRRSSTYIERIAREALSVEQDHRYHGLQRRHLVALIRASSFARRAEEGGLVQRDWRPRGGCRRTRPLFSGLRAASCAARALAAHLSATVGHGERRAAPLRCGRPSVDDFGDGVGFLRRHRGAASPPAVTRARWPVEHFSAGRNPGGR